ncbi:MAG: trypsin-like peptidase domain-containing protein [candidate division Zixibacteria bacterium]|nr:trypsin-like peptidase domain-containing protein [candidate division Zixibacteria bacterium]
MSAHQKYRVQPIRRAVALFAVFATLAASPASVRAQTDSIGPLSVLQMYERDLRAIVSTVGPSMVTVRGTQSAERTRITRGVPNPSMLVGSGIVLDTTGIILTCSRVVEGSDDFWVETADGRLFQAALLGSSDEVAVLQIKVQGLRPPRFGEAVELGVGSFVGAIGNSYGYSGGVSWGEVNGFRPDGTIQLSLGVAPGSTGGALVNSRGEVVGLIKAKISEPFYLDPLQCPAGKEGGSITVPGRRLELPTSSVSLAVPIQAALRAAERVIASGAVPRAYVGVYVEDLTGWYVTHFKTSEGVLVSDVVEKTPAQKSGMLDGDVITAVDRERIRSVRHFRQVVSQARPGQRMLFDLIRGGVPLKMVIELGRADAPNLSAVTNEASPRLTSSPAEQPRSGSSGTPFIPSADAANRPRSVDPATVSGLQAADFDRRLQELQRVADSLRQELSRLRGNTPR